MREIIHVQAGSFSNYTGTHYWNTQENYLVNDQDDIDHSVSFTEGRDDHNQHALCPRLLAFDQKSNFGTLARDSHRNETLTGPTVWHGEVALLEQERIPKSEYHSLLDAEHNTEQETLISPKIRYWSDFSRVFFDPKSIQAVSDMPEVAAGDWRASRDSFFRYDKDVELMDGPLRLLVEDCDNFQGLQMIQDTSTFGGFSDCFLSTFREEHPKVTAVIFTCLSNVSPLDTSAGDSSQIKQALNDALSLRSAIEFCNLSVPISSPSRWENCWYSGHNIDNKSLYQTSAVLSTYIETATLPSRLKGGLNDLQTMVAHLNWKKSSPLAVLRGALYPQGLSTELLHNTPSLSFHYNDRATFARRDVSRGFSEDEITLYDKWSSSQEPLLVRHHSPSYPVPSSFPPIFPGVRPKALKLVSTLSTSPSMVNPLSGYIHFVEHAAKRRDAALLATGVESDEVKDLVNALWSIVDGYGEIGSSNPSEGMGEDEE